MSEARAAATLALRDNDRVAVLWGGGLGDALAIRPLLQRLAARLRQPPLFLCASPARTGLFAELGVTVEEVAVPRQPADALRFVRRLGRFDLVYLGPHPTLPTRVVAGAMRAGRVWAEPGPTAGQFIPRTVCLDVARLGLASSGEDVPLYGGTPLFAGGAPARPRIGARYLAVHMTARPHWEAKQWPLDRWVAWLGQVLASGALHVACLGTPEERAMLDAAVGSLPPDSRARVLVETDLAPAQLEQRIRESAGVVCHNSGTMHVAVAHRKPTVVLTGSPAHFWRPDVPWALNLTSGACGLACNQHRCPVPFFRAQCIRSLDVAAVAHAVQTHIGSAGQAFAPLPFPGARHEGA